MAEEIQVGDELRLKRHVVGDVGVRASVIGVGTIDGCPDVKRYLVEISNQGLRVVGVEDLDLDEPSS